MSKLADAVDCFQDNLNRLGPRAGQTIDQHEKYNLYNGLAALAEGLMQLQAEVQALQSDIIDIRSAVERR